jgi:hypothetical protein
MLTLCAENTRGPSIPKEGRGFHRKLMSSSTYPDGGTEKLDIDTLIVLGPKRRVHHYRVEEAMPANVSRSLL